MGKSSEKRRAEVRFSLPALLGLFLCWLVACLLAFFLGFLTGRKLEVSSPETRFPVSDWTADTDPPQEFTFPEILPLSERGPEERLAGSSAPGPGPQGDDVGRGGGGADPARAPALKQREEPARDMGAGGEAPSGRILQVASFRETERAEKQVRELRQAGYPCFSAPSRNPETGEIRHRVFVGPYHTDEEAERVREELEATPALRGVLIRSWTGSP